MPSTTKKKASKKASGSKPSKKSVVDKPAPKAVELPSEEVSDDDDEDVEAEQDEESDDEEGHDDEGSEDEDEEEDDDGVEEDGEAGSDEDGEEDEDEIALDEVKSDVSFPRVFIGRRPKVVVARNLGPDVMPLLEKRSDIKLVLWPGDGAADPAWILENVRGAAALLVMMTDKVGLDVYEAAGPSLQVVSTMSVGYEHINLAEASKRGVKVGYTPDVLTNAVADLSIMLALMAGRNVKHTMQVVNDGSWPNSPWAPYIFCGPQLSASPINPKRTAGFLGFGRISQGTLARLIPFGITDCINSSNPKSKPNTQRDAAIQAKHKLNSLRRVDLDELARESDVLFILAPGGELTRHLVNEDFLRKMKRTSVLVNAARGTLVDSDALAKALSEGWIWGAGLDVVEDEPMVTKDHPLVKEPQCVILPHIGSGTNETRVGIATLAVKNVLTVLDGQDMLASVDLSLF